MKKRKGKKLKTYKASAEEKQRYERIFATEKEKFIRDSLAGGVSAEGHYVRLHDRYS